MNSKEKVLLKWKGLCGFWEWLKYFQPRILTKGLYEKWVPTQDQRLYIIHSFFPDVQMCLNVQPRRHGKSTVNIMLILHRITSTTNTTIQLLGITESHGLRTMIRPLKGIINNTPRLRRIIPQEKEYQQRTEIILPHLGNRVQLFSGLGAFGDKLDVLWVSDLHNFIDMAAFEAFQGSLLDQENTLILIDSNVDHIGGYVDNLEQAAVKDKTIFCQAVSYPDLENYLKNAPPWINRQKAIALAKNNPLSMKRDLLGLRRDASSCLFTGAMIKNAQDSYTLPVQDIEAITKGRKYKIGGGLDRSKKLIPGVRGDKTVWSVIMKVAVAGGESAYHLLNQVSPKLNTDKALKKIILDDHTRYGLDSCYLEDFHISDDMQNWLARAGIPFKIVSPTSNNQNSAFPEFYRIMSEGRFKYPKALKTFSKELSTFSIKENKNGSYSFGHTSSRGHDDTVYSVGWGLYGLSKFQLDLYELPVLSCKSRGVNKNHCFLLGGDHVISCSRRCGAFQTVNEFYQNHVRISLDDDITLPEFFNDFVTVHSSIIS